MKVEKTVAADCFGSYMQQHCNSEHSSLKVDFKRNERLLLVVGIGRSFLSWSRSGSIAALLRRPSAAATSAEFRDVGRTATAVATVGWRRRRSVAETAQHLFARFQLVQLLPDLFLLTS